MTDDASRRHDDLSRLFAEIADLPAPQRDARLDEIGASDSALASELRGLLLSDSGQAAIDRSPAVLPPFGDPDEAPTRVGAFEVGPLIGRGGMGSVYRARQREPERDVALKIVRANLLAPDAARRLRFEAAVLARLDHPNIARIYDAGTLRDEGGELSYFAMELVEGVPITEALGAASVAERVSTLALVCDAVQHAHQRGVIHRDLKPGNILVDGEGRPRVLDFGIARLLDADVQVTSAGYGSGSLIGTVAYMSPEQLDGRDDLIDTRSDVYALGAVLYELLAGEPPVRVAGRSLAEAVHAARTVEIAPLRRSGARVPCDLETVVAKALERSIDRRYASASELAADLRRVLAHEPVHARRQTAGYRAARFARRNPALCVAGAAAGVLLLAALGGVVYGYSESVRRTEELEAANRVIAAEAEKAIAVNEFLRRMLVSADPLGETGAGRADMTVVEMLDRESGQIAEAFEGLPGSEASVRSTIGGVYMSLGKLEEAEPHLRRSLELHEQVWGVGSIDAERAERDLAVLLSRTGRGDEAIAIFRDVLARLDRDGRAGTADDAITSIRAGAVLLGQGAYAEAESLLRRAIPIIERESAERSDALPAALNNLARALSGQGKRAEAEELYIRARDAFAERFGPDHPSVAIASVNIAAMRYARGDLEGAIESYRDVIRVLQPIMGDEHPQVAVTRHNLAYALYDRGDFKGSLRELELALVGYRATYGPDHPETLTTLMAAADTLAELDRHAEAAEQYAEVAEGLLARDPDDARAQRARYCRGQALIELGRAEEGDALMVEAAAAYLRLEGPGTPSGQRFLRELAARRLGQGRLEEARAYAADLNPDDPRHAELLGRINAGG
ncbi:MAG: serine/threonine-protein kinase [Phycisphaerales bacterium]